MYMHQKVNAAGEIEFEQVQCPPLGLNPEATCEDGELDYKTGFWHDGLKRSSENAGYYENEAGFLLSSSDRFYTCPCSACCNIADTKTGAVHCAKGTDGLLCTQCLDDYYRNSEGTCSECTATDKNMSGAIAMITLLGVIMAAYMFFPTSKLPKRVRDTWRLGSDRLKQAVVATRLVTLAKIVTGFYQVLLLLGEIYDIPFPRLYVDFLYRWFSWFQLDFFTMVRVECVRKMNYYQTTMVSALLMVTLQLLAIFFFAKGEPNRGAPFLVVAYFFYSPTSARIFQIFNCRKIDGGIYLTRDYSMDCDTDSHRAYEMFACFMVAIIAIGLPLMYFLILYYNRKDLHKLKKLAFFISDYKSQYKYWECVECIRKVLLAGAAVFFGRGSLMQIALSTCLVLVYLILLQRYEPYKHDNVFAFTVNLCLFFTLFVGIFVKLLAGWTTKGIYEEGFSIEALTGLLILCASLVIIDFVCQISCRLYTATPLLRAHEKRMALLPTISAELAKLPRADPPPGPAFYAIANPMGGAVSPQQKLTHLKELRRGNVRVLEAFFSGLSKDSACDLVRTNKASDVVPGVIFIKLNSKTDASTLAKAVRPILLKKYPLYGLEHIRDNLRFKCITASVTDAFVFLRQLIRNGWEVVKFDINKFLEPLEWGWRFLGCDVRMPNGMLVECYVVRTLSLYSVLSVHVLILSVLSVVYSYSVYSVF
jgi:hypothetical protein